MAGISGLELPPWTSIHSHPNNPVQYGLIKELFSPSA